MYRTNAKPDGEETAVQPRHPGEVLYILADLTIRTTEAYNGWIAELASPRLNGPEGSGACLGTSEKDATAKLIVQLWALVTARAIEPEVEGDKPHFAAVLTLYDREMGPGDGTR